LEVKAVKSNMKLATKLMLSFAGVAFVTLLLGFSGYYGTLQSDKAIKEIGIVRLSSVQSLQAIKLAANSIKAAQRTLMDLGLEKTLRQRQYQNIASDRKAYEEAWKIYEPLPQTPEEALLWKDFVPAWEKWREENNKFLEISKKIDALDLGDPYELAGKIELFRADHYKLVAATLTLLKYEEAFSGGESHTDCDFGKWLSTFKTSNTTAQSLIEKASESHKRFHDAIVNIKRLASTGKYEDAANIYESQMVPPMNMVFDKLAVLKGLANEDLTMAREMEHQGVTVARAAQQKAYELLDKLIALNANVAAETVKSEAGNANFMKAFSLIAMIIGVILAMFLGFFITRSITKPINRITEGLDQAAEQVASASSQVSSASQSLAEGASEQAASIEETSSSLEEMSSMTKQNADNATQCDQIMRQEVGANFRLVEERLTQMQDAIAKTVKAGDETGKIIKTIDEIAFQTNLLALNAAVEAARAGEAGAGFAVVADEVRNLAMRAAEAAKNTNNLIEESNKRIKETSQLNSQVVEAMKTNATMGQKVSQLVSEIAAASNEQAQGIEQINKAVAEMDKVVQQVAANAEESASASEEMNAQAEEMKVYVGEMFSLVSGTTEKGAGRSAKKASRPSERLYEETQSALVKRDLQRPALPKGNEVKPHEVIPT